MARQKLTAGRIRDFECPEGIASCSCGTLNVPAWASRPLPAQRFIIYQGRLEGKTIGMKRGDCRNWAIDSADPEKPGARQEARRLQGLIDRDPDLRRYKKKRLDDTAQKQEQAHREKPLFRTPGNLSSGPATQMERTPLFRPCGNCQVRW